MKISKRNFIYIIILTFIVRIIFSFLTWHPDVNNHVDWGIRFFEYGASEFYEPDSNVWSFTWPNQPPGTIYLYAFIYQAFKFIFDIFWQINIRIPVFPSIIITFFEDTLYQAMLQWPAILADFGMTCLIYKIVKQNLKSKKAQNLGKLAAITFLVNPVIWYNSSIWGQTDSLINFFVLLSFYWLFRKKPAFSVFAYALSLYLKISLLIFAPIYAILFIKLYKKPVIYLKSIFTSLFLIGVFTLPFSSYTNPFTYLYKIYSEKVLIQQLHVITANAFNLWSAVAGIHERPHTQMLGPLSYQYWSYLIFGSIFIYLLIRLIKSKQNEMLTYKVVALTAFASFLFLTNMHERYLYPLFPYFTIILFFNLDLKREYVVTSIINLLNLYNFWWYPKVGILVSFLSFGDRLMPRILGLVNTVLFLQLYKLLVLNARKTT